MRTSLHVQELNTVWLDFFPKQHEYPENAPEESHLNNIYTILLPKPDHLGRQMGTFIWDPQGNLIPLNDPIYPKRVPPIQTVEQNTWMDPMPPGPILQQYVSLSSIGCTREFGHVPSHHYYHGLDRRTTMPEAIWTALDDVLIANQTTHLWPPKERMMFVYYHDVHELPLSHKLWADGLILNTYVFIPSTQGPIGCKAPLYFPWYRHPPSTSRWYPQIPSHQPIPT